MPELVSQETVVFWYDKKQRLNHEKVRLKVEREKEPRLLECEFHQHQPAAPSFSA